MDNESDDIVQRNLIDNAPARILIQLNEGKEIASEIYSETGITYSHIVKTLDKMEPRYVEFEKDGRKKFITLTDEGKMIADALENVKSGSETSENSG